MKKVSAVIVTYNRLKLLKECLKDLLNQKYELNNIIIVNNKSTDGTKEYLDNLSNNKVIIVNSKKNLGGAGGFSLGTKVAYEKTDSDYFWLMDDDTMTSPTSLNAMMTKAHDLHYDFGFLCSNVRWWKDGSAALTNAPQVTLGWNNDLTHGLVRVKSTSFVSVMFPRVLVKKLGLPIGQMFIWGDDVEFTTRLSTYNNHCYLVDNSFVYHKSAVNKVYSIINSDRVKYYKYGIRNKLFIFRKYYNSAAVFKKILSCLFYLVKIPFCAHSKRGFRMYCVLYGLSHGLFFKPSVKFPN